MKIVVSSDICIVCAWRGTCQKIFSVNDRDIKCTDFVRDISIKEETFEKDKTEEESQDKRQSTIHTPFKKTRLTLLL